MAIWMLRFIFFYKRNPHFGKGCLFLHEPIIIVVPVCVSEPFGHSKFSTAFTPQINKLFYEDAYKAAIEIVGGEQYILSAVMHADERNRAMSEALGQDVFHYHLHVVYVPVVEKQILWSRRCKHKSLVGTVKKTIMQVSSSKR